MRLEVCTVDHDPLRLRSFTRETGKDAVKDTNLRPADEAIVECLVRPVALRCVLPLQAIADHIDDATDDAPVIDPGTPCDNGKWGEIRSICALLSRNRSIIAASINDGNESNYILIRKWINRF